MNVNVDEPRYQPPPGEISSLPVAGPVTGSDFGDAIALDDDVAGIENALGRHDARTTENLSSHRSHRHRRIRSGRRRDFGEAGEEVGVEVASKTRLERDLLQRGDDGGKRLRSTGRNGHAGTSLSDCDDMCVPARAKPLDEVGHVGCSGAGRGKGEDWEPALDHCDRAVPEVGAGVALGQQ